MKVIGAAVANERNSTMRWTSPSTGVFMGLAALVGILCSWQLLAAELKILRDPEAVLTCDLNPLIACSDSLLAPQAHLFFGMPNSVVGLVMFAMMFAVAAVLTTRGSLPRPLWIGLSIGAVAGSVYVAYFLYLSIAVFGKLCPYCMGVWAATLLYLPLAIGGAGAAGALGQGAKKWGKSVHRYWWAIALVLYLLVILIIVVTMSDKIGYLFG